ncbi:MAG: hypothetical protein WCW54_02150 [Candidatus Paceibacterota bacterium]
MKKYKKSELFAVSLILGMAFYLPVSLVKAETVKESNNNVQINSNGEEDNNLEDVKSKDNNSEDNQGDNEDNQKEIKNQQGDNEADNQKDQNDDQDEDNQFDGQEHLGVMADSVSNLLEVADKEDGEVSDKIKEIAKEQDLNKDEVSKEIDQIHNRSKFKIFLIGTDYENIGQLRSEMVKISDQIDQLNGLLDQTKKAENKTVIQEQVKVLEQEQQKIGDLLVSNESKFSLFGWFMKMFSK